MTTLFARHEGLLRKAVAALGERGFWTPFPEVPSGKIYGAAARAEGLASYEARLGRPFALVGHPESGRVGAEVSPWGPRLGISYPAAPAEALVAAAEAAAPAWAALSPDARAGILVEALVRLNAMSFEMANAVTHTTGQAFPMAFQAGGPHAQDRGLEAVAAAWEEMNRAPARAIWEKPGRGAPIVIEKHWRVVPRGIGLVIGCQTFPTWNSYPGLFASLATGNPVIVKPHPGAILPLALSVAVLRDLLAEQGLPRDIVLLAADTPEAPITKDLVRSAAIRIIDYTGSNAFDAWVRAHAGAEARVYAEEAGVNSVVIAGTDDFAGMCANLAFSLALYSGQMCTAPQTLFVPKEGIETDEGHKGFEEVARGIGGAIDALLADPERAAGVCGALANPATLKRVAEARGLGRVVRDSAPLGAGRSATPLLVAVAEEDEAAYGTERFGPIAFLVAVPDAEAGIARATALARRKGAITAALYDRDEARIGRAAEAFARAGVNLSVNLTGEIYVNQSAAFSDFHVTGLNPAGNASLTDAAFVAGRFARAMWRRPIRPDAQ